MGPDRRVNELNAWAAARAPELLARAEAEAVVVLRDALVAAAAAGRPVAPPDLPDSPRRPRVDAEPAAEQPPQAVSAPSSREAETGELLWAYCVLRDGDTHPLGLPGVDAQGDVEEIGSDGLVALVSRVPRSAFGPEPLRDNLNDLSWLERIARAHEAVLEETLLQSTLIPLRLCTLYESADGVRHMLSERREVLLAALDGLAGRYEWSVKVLVDRDRLMEAARTTVVPDTAGEPTAGGEGGAYLLGRRTDRAVREAANALRADVAERVHARLQDWAIDGVTRPPQNPELSGHTGDMVLNGAYLVEGERTDDLRALIAELEDHHRQLGVRIELGGPWPPYNFVPGGE
ncbi:MAG: GvpL/GvpF family gas vesicle protein [Solirubrobacteraceae bacterium]